MCFLRIQIDSFDFIWAVSYLCLDIEQLAIGLRDHYPQ